MNEFGFYIVGPHTVEVSYSGSGMYSPWHLHAMEQNNIQTMMTSDVGYFVRIDKNEIYKVECGNPYLFVTEYVEKMRLAYMESMEAGDACISEFIGKMEPHGTVEEFLKKFKK